MTELLFSILCEIKSNILLTFLIQFLVMNCLRCYIADTSIIELKLFYKCRIKH